MSLVLALVLMSAFVACGDDATGGDNNYNGNSDSDAGVDDDGSTTGDADVQHDAMVDPPTAVLEIYALDIWAQPLPETEATLTVTSQSQPVATTGHPVALVNLYDAGDYEITLEAPDHETQQVTVAWDGGSTVDGATVTPAAGGPAHGFSVSHEMRDIYGVNLPIHSVYLGLRHQWFSAQGRPARRGNDIELLMDGEDAWSSTYTDLTAATTSIMIATWWWESDFELVRDPATHHLLTPTERYDNTILGILESSPAVHRVLIGEFWGEGHDILDWLNTDAAMGTYAETANDGFEILGQGNGTMGVFQFEADPFLYGDRVRSTFPETTGRSFETETDIASNVPSREVDLTWWPISVEIQLASYHQKFMVVDQQVAYVGGMNVKATDWDTSDHEVFEFRRMGFDANRTEREDVMSKDSESDTGPRKDYIIRLEGPSVQDAADIFHIRWAHQIAEGVLNAEYATDFVVDRNQPEMPGGSQIQVTATLPQPFWEHAIAETWINAVNQAQDFIFIEDQYWRIPMLTEVIIARMNQVPGLRLLVVTKPVDEWTDPGCSWTHETHQELKTLFPSRYATYQLRAFDVVDVGWGIDETEERYTNMDVHSKMLIVDDKFMSVGSCNKNNRGIVYEGELNVAVLDPVWVRAERRRIMANMLPAGVPATNDVATWWTQFSDAAVWNDYVWQNWDDEWGDLDLGDGSDPLPPEYIPDGFVHGLIFREVVDCLIEDVGPDMT